jgi:hypothetical protein
MTGEMIIDRDVLRASMKWAQNSRPPLRQPMLEHGHGGITFSF